MPDTWLSNSWRQRLPGLSATGPAPPRPPPNPGEGAVPPPRPPAGGDAAFQLTPEEATLAAIRLAARHQPEYPKPAPQPAGNPQEAPGYPLHELLASAPALAPYSEDTLAKQETLANDLSDRLRGAFGNLFAHQERGAPEKKKVPWWHKILYGMLSGATTPFHQAPLGVYHGLKRRKHHKALDQHEAIGRGLLQDIGNMQALHSTQADRLDKMAALNTEYWQHALSEETGHRKNQGAYLEGQEKRRFEERQGEAQRRTAMRGEQQQFQRDFLADHISLSEATRASRRDRDATAQALRDHGLAREAQNFEQSLRLAEYVNQVNKERVKPYEDQIAKRVMARIGPEEIGDIQTRLMDVMRAQLVGSGIRIRDGRTDDGSFVPELDMDRTAANVASLPFKLASMMEWATQKGLNPKWKATMSDPLVQSSLLRLQTGSPESLEARAQALTDLLAKSLDLQPKNLEELRTDSAAKEFFNNILAGFFHQAQQATIIESEGNMGPVLQMLDQLRGEAVQPARQPGGSWGIAPVERASPPRPVPMLGGRPQPMGPPRP